MEHERDSFNRKQFFGVAAGMAAGLTGVAGLTGCGGSSATAVAGKSKGIIVFGQGAINTAVYKPLWRGAQEAGKRRGYQLLQSYDNLEPVKQIDELNTWIAQKVNGMCILPLNESAMAPLINKAHQAGIKWSTYAGSLPGEDGYCWWNNAQGAQLFAQDCAKWINKNLPGNGPVEVALFTQDSTVNGRQRVRGGFDALKKLVPRATVVAQTAGVAAAEVYTAMQSVISAHPHVNVVICISDDGAVGAAKAFLATNPSSARVNQMYIMGYDGSLPAMKTALTGSSPLRASIAVPPVEVGKWAIDTTANAIEGKEPTHFLVNYKLVTAANQAVGKQLLAEYA
jgi:ABC-type sugar transport system substrate-binding protein